MLGKEKHGNILSMQMAKKNEEVVIDSKFIEENLQQLNCFLLF